jgi:SAM-dependent methyltransferase
MTPMEATHSGFGAGSLSRLAACVRERRLPYAATRAFASPAAARFHRPLLNALLAAGAHRRPRSLSHGQSLKLHRQYPIRDGYKYDPESKDLRAQERLGGLTRLVDLTRARDVAEVGAGDGRLALKLRAAGLRPQLLDAADWRDEDVKRSDIPFWELSGSGDYPLSDGSVDLVVSYNAFEHIPDPAVALREMVRITRPGGAIYLSFCPLYNSPFGLHAYRTYYAPYPQFLLAPDVLRQFIAENGINDLGETRTEFQYVNRWSLDAYLRLLRSPRPDCAVRTLHIGRDYDHLGLVYRHLPCFWGRGLTFDELTAAHLQVHLVKPE